MKRLKKILKKRFGDKVRLEEEIRKGIWPVITPLYYNDGDGVTMYVKPMKKDFLKLTDYGNLFGLRHEETFALQQYAAKGGFERVHIHKSVLYLKSNYDIICDDIMYFAMAALNIDSNIDEVRKYLKMHKW